MSRSYTSLLSWFGLTIAASLMLYHTSDRVNGLSQRLSSLNSQIEAEQQSLHVLKAEWVYLANPARIDAAARRHLDLQPTTPNRVVNLKNMGSLLPIRDGVEPTPPIETADATPAPGAMPAPMAAPMSSVKASELSVLHAAHVKTEHVMATLSGAHAKTEHVMAALTTPHLNEHMIMSHTGALESSGDSIGSLINTMSLRQ